MGTHGWIQCVVAIGLASMPSRSDAARSRSLPDWAVTALGRGGRGVGRAGAAGGELRCVVAQRVLGGHAAATALPGQPGLRRTAYAAAWST